MRDPSLAWAGFIGLFFLAVYVDNTHLRWRQTRDRPRSRDRTRTRLSRTTRFLLPVGSRWERLDRFDKQAWALLIFGIVCCVVGVSYRLGGW